MTAWHNKGQDCDGFNSVVCIKMKELRGICTMNQPMYKPSPVRIIADIKAVCIFAALIYTFLLLSGCTHAPRRHRGKLSEAMEKSSNEYKGERRISDPEPRHHEPVYEDKPGWKRHDNPVAFPSPSDDTGDRPDPQDDDQDPQTEPPHHFTDVSSKDYLFSLTGGTGFIGGEDFYGTKHFSVSIGDYVSEYQRFELFGQVLWAPVKETSELDQSIEDGIFMIGAGINYKWFTTPRHTFLGQYFILGAAVNEMFWSYENTIMVEDGEEIGSDHITGLELTAGLGVHLVQTQDVQIGVEVLPNIMFWGFTTSEGFSNDVFSHFTGVKFRVTVTFMPD